MEQEKPKFYIKMSSNDFITPVFKSDGSWTFHAHGDYYRVIKGKPIYNQDGVVIDTQSY